MPSFAVLPLARRLLSHLAGAVLLAVAACDSADAPPPRPEVVDPGPGTDTLAPQPVPLPPPPAWRMDEAGPLLAVAGVTPRTAVLVLPEYADSTLAELPVRDVSGIVPLRVDLFAPGGEVAEGVIVEAEGRAEDGCPAWPRAAVRAAEGSVLRPWTVALAAGRAESIPLDSIESLASADSAQLAAEVARLASAAPGDTATALDGLPYVVRSARRFAIDARTQGLVARAERRLASEAQPLVEHLLLVAERSTASPRVRWRLAYSERALGTEMTVETAHVLAALRVGDGGRPSLVVARDRGEGSTYVLLERVRPGEWRVRWSSAFAAC